MALYQVDYRLAVDGFIEIAADSAEEACKKVAESLHGDIEAIDAILIDTATDHRDPA